jgi:hypothetical protein
MKRVAFLFATAAIGLLLATPANAISIGNWSGSNRSWNHSDFSSIQATMTLAGHNVLADSAISAANLAGVDMYIIGEATSTPGAAELQNLRDFVESGNCLLVSTNSSFSGGTDGNAILAGIGSTMSFASDFANASGPFQGGNFATTGPPYNLVGQNLAVSPGNRVNGGTTLYDFGIHVEQLGNGFVFAFGDRYDHDFASPNNTNTNGQFFLNIAYHHAIPEPSTLVLIALGVVVMFGRPVRRA